MLKSMNKVEIEIVSFISNSLAMVCVNDKDKCKGLNRTVILRNLSKLKHIKYSLTYNYENLLPIMQEIKKNYKSKISNYKVNDYINAFISFLKDDKNEAKWRKLNSVYNEFKSNYETINSNIHNVNSNTVKVIVIYLKDIVKRYGNESKEGIALSFSDIKLFKDKDKYECEKYMKQYNKLISMLLNKVGFIIQKDKRNLLTLTELNKKLNEANFPKLFNTDSDKILIDLDMNLFNERGIRLQSKLDPYRSIIKINQNYDPKKDNAYLLTFRTLGTKSVQFIYSIDYKRKVNAMKYEKVWKVIKELKKYRAKWLRLMKDSQIKTKSYAVACEILYETAMRIGTKGNASKGQETFGLLTLLVKHIKLNNDTVEFSFLGKGGGSILNFTLKNKLIHDFFEVSIKNKKPNDLLFSITPEGLNDFIRKTLGMNITVHKFRTLKATNYAYDKLIVNNPNKGKELSDSEFKSYLQKVLLEIGKMLGHYSGTKIAISTSLKNYIDPLVIKEYYLLFKKPLHKQIQQLLEYENPDRDVYTEVPNTWGGRISYKEKLTYYVRHFI